MKLTVLASALLLTFTQTGYAETCRDKFIHYMTEYKGFFPVRNHIVSTPKGGKASVNNFYMTKTGHWMTEMITPESPWTLVYNNKMYTSADKGKSWKMIRTLDSQQNNNTNEINQRKNAETVKNAKCGEEEHNGVMHETIEAEFTNFQVGPAEMHTKYWIDRKTAYVAKSTSDLKSKNYSSFTTQVMEPAPELVLPTPE